MSDPVNHPPHYGGKDNPYETIKVIERWALDFNLGNAIKYISRAGMKQSTTALEDLKKARWYLDREIQTFEQNKKYLEEIRQEAEKEHANRSRGVREHQNNEPLSNADTGADVLPQSRQGSDPQGNEPVPGGEEEKGSVSGPTDATIWGWDDDSQRRVGPDQDPTRQAGVYEEILRDHEARKAAVAERLRELERMEQAAQIIRAYQNEAERQKKEVHDAFEQARRTRDRGVGYRDLFGEAHATE